VPAGAEENEAAGGEEKDVRVGGDEEKDVGVGDDEEEVEGWARRCSNQEEADAS
jgi:hypothetical protein